MTLTNYRISLINFVSVKDTTVLIRVIKISSMTANCDVLYLVTGIRTLPEISNLNTNVTVGFTIDIRMLR